MNQVVHSTATGEESKEGRDYLPTRGERWRPVGLDRPNAPGVLDRHVRLSPAMLRHVLRECERRGLRLSDCTFQVDGSVLIP